MSSSQKQCGFAMLIVLIAIAIIMLLTFMQMDTFFGGSGLSYEPAGIEQHPWVLEELLVPEGEKVKLPRSPKLLMSESFTIDALVSRNETKRGMVRLGFDRDGRVTGRWECSYEQSGVNYQIKAEMNGNIDAKHTYRNEAGQKDKSRLFCIAQGKYTKTPVDQTAAGGETGTAWLIGWINPDRSIEGHVTITRNEEWAAAYAFTGPQ